MVYRNTANRRERNRSVSAEVLSAVRNIMLLCTYTLTSIKCSAETCLDVQRHRVFEAQGSSGFHGQKHVGVQCKSRISDSNDKCNHDRKVKYDGGFQTGSKS